MWRRLTAWARTEHHQHSERERALRLLWSDEVLEVSDETVAWIGRVLGLDHDPQPHNTAETQPHNTVNPQQKVQVNR